MRTKKIITIFLATVSIGLMPTQADQLNVSLYYHQHSKDGKKVQFLMEGVPEPRTDWLQRNTYTVSDWFYSTPCTIIGQHYSGADIIETDLSTLGVTNGFRLYKEAQAQGDTRFTSNTNVVIVPPEVPQVARAQISYDSSNRWILYPYRARLDNDDSVRIEKGPSPEGPWEEVDPPTMHNHILSPMGYARIAIDIDPYMVPQYTRLVINGSFVDGTVTNILTQHPPEEITLSNPVINIAGDRVSFDFLCITHGGYGHLMTSVDDGLTWQFTEFSGGYPVVLPQSGTVEVDLDPNVEYQLFRIKADGVPTVESSSYSYTAYSNVISIPERDLELEVDDTVLTLTWSSDPDETYRVMSTHSLKYVPWINASDDMVASNVVSSWSTNLPTANKHFYRLQIKTEPDQYEDLDYMAGYSKETVLPYGWKMVANQFVGTNEISSTIGETYGDSLPDGTEILAHTGNGFNVYTYFGTWYDDMFNDASNVLIDRGDGVWVHNTSDQVIEVILSGKLSTSGTTTNVLSTGFNMVANPYPTMMELTDISDVNFGDEVYIWNGTGYEVYDYWGVWGHGGVYPWPLPVEIPVGAGFWYISTVDRYWVMDSPY